MDLDEFDGKLYRSIIVWKMRDTKISMVRHPMEIRDDGIVIEWDKYLKITPHYVKTEPLPQEEINEMKKAMEEVKVLTKVEKPKEYRREEELEE